MKSDISNDGPIGFKPNLFKKLSAEDQVEFMRDWFYERYEDPAQRTPYITAEGGYQYIYGGPFGAEEVLRDNFESEAHEGVIDELADELSNECSDWTYTPHQDEYDYLSEFDDIVKDSEFISRLSTSLDIVVRIANHSKKLDVKELKFSNMMNFSFCITLMEAYLSDTFTRSVMSNSNNKAKYLKSEVELAKTKFYLSEVFEKFESVDNIIKKQISQTSFHNLPLIKSIFRSVLEIDVGDIKNLTKYVEKRHDFVHRGGKNTIGEDVSTNSEEIENLITTIKTFTLFVDSELVSKKLIQGSQF